MMTRKICMFLLLCLILTGCGSNTFKENADISLEELKAANERLEDENERLKSENELLRKNVAFQTNLEQVKNLEGYSKNDFEELQDEFEKLMLNPRTYEPEDIVPLFYYICGNTDVIKEIYDSGNETLAEAIIETHMSWGGQFSHIADFLKTWTRTTTAEQSGWNEMIYNESLKAFDIFKYYPLDMKTAEATLPEKVFSEIMSIHEKRDIFPEGITKADFE